MPAMSNVRTPMRLLAMPRRTPWCGSLCCLKKALSASASASGSRSSPPTTIPGSRSCLSDLDELGDAPLLTTRAAASCDAPILRPTSFLSRRPERGVLHVARPALALRLASPSSAFGSFSPGLRRSALGLREKRTASARLAEPRPLPSVAQPELPSASSSAEEVRELDLFLHVHGLGLRHPQAAGGHDAALDDGAAEKPDELLGLGGSRNATSSVMTPRRTSSARACSIVCMPFACRRSA